MPKRVTKTKRRQQRPVPVPQLTAEEEAFLSAITASANFTREKSLQIYQNLEWQRIEERDNVTDKELIACMRGAPDAGGSLLTKLGEFVRKRGEK